MIQQLFGRLVCLQWALKILQMFLPQRGLTRSPIDQVRELLRPKMNSEDDLQQAGEVSWLQSFIRHIMIGIGR